MKQSLIKVGNIELHVVELGEGEPVLLVHGFPDTARGWRGQIEVLAAAGYRAIAPDMRGFGRSSAPADAALYTRSTVGDLVGLLDALKLPTVTVVGHDFGASVAWNAALLRPDRFTAVFGTSVPFQPLGGPSLLETMRSKPDGDKFYMFDQIRPEADRNWSNAAVTIPAFLYWSSGSPPPGQRWDPLAGGANMTRPAPVAVSSWAAADDVAFTVAEFGRTGFHGGLNYYRAIQSYADASQAFSGLTIRQPSFFLVGEVDGLHQMLKPTEAQLRKGLPGLRGFVELPGVGHWPHREAADKYDAALLGFLKGL